MRSHCRRSLAVRSERWDRPPSTLPRRGTSAQSPGSHPANSSDECIAPTFKRRASASASSPLGLEPERAQPTAQEPVPGPARQSAHRQLSSPVTCTAAPLSPSPEQGAVVKSASFPVPPLRLGSLGAVSSPGSKSRTGSAAIGAQPAGTRSSASRGNRPPHPTESMSASQHMVAGAQIPQGRSFSTAAARSSAMAAQGSAPQEPTNEPSRTQPSADDASTSSGVAAAVRSAGIQGPRREAGIDVAPQWSPFEQAADPALPTEDTPDIAASTQSPAAVPAEPSKQLGRHPTERSVTMDPALGGSGNGAVEDDSQAASQSAPHEPHAGGSPPPPAQQATASTGAQSNSWAAVGAGGNRQAAASSAAVPDAPAARSRDLQQPARAPVGEAWPTSAAMASLGESPTAPHGVPPLPGQGAFGSGSGSGKSQQVGA
jgi:hypothetical protein